MAKVEWCWGWSGSRGVLYGGGSDLRMERAGVGWGMLVVGWGREGCREVERGGGKW